VKDKFPGIKTVMGGGVFADHLSLKSPNFNEFAARTTPYIDGILIGEGEILFRKYLSGELNTGKRVFCLEDIKNENLDLDSAPVPDFSGLNLPAYSQMVTYASRSCPYQCCFCSETVQWGRFRRKNVNRIIAELTGIKETYGGKLFMFADSFMNPVMSELSRLLIDKKDKVDIYWDGYLRADTDVCDKENAALWRRAGFYRARLGIESGSRHVLDLMNKKITPGQIKESLNSLAGAGIKTTTYWVIGYPGEREEDFRETLDLIAELKDDIYEVDSHPFYFYPDGQVRSEQWVKEYDIEPLYPQEFDDLLLTNTWVLSAGPGREEIFDRLNRFAEACKKFGIHNRYSLMNIYQADLRWNHLHPNCGPGVLELFNYKYTGENK
jgi:radical SAM superfamily enzyme YgiQ (UPF0313 family)